jgi:hypothetical protein
MDFATTLVPKVSRAQFIASLQPGDAVYCWGTEEISKIIEDIAKGPSHVLTVWKLPWTPWLTAESTFPSMKAESASGVHVGLLMDYIYGYPGNLVLTRRDVTPDQVYTELGTALNLLDYNYNWKTEISIAVREFLPFLPAIEEKNQLYCSGLRQRMCLETVPYSVPGPDPATPEQCYTDPTTNAVCVLMQGEK